MKKTLGVLAIMFALRPAAGQDLRFETVVNSTTVTVGRQFEVSFTMTSSQSIRLRNFSPPDFKGFVVLSGPVESSQYQWINGRATSTLSYVYVVSVQNPGTYTINSASVEYDGKRYSTAPLQIKAIQGENGAGDQKDELADLKDQLFIRAVAEKARVRQGEQFVVTHKLYTRVNIDNYVVSKAPTYEGFWAEDLDKPGGPEVSTETLNGQQYRVAVIKRTALFATQPGKMRITPIEVRCAVQVRRRSSDPFDIFNDPFFSRMRTQEVDVASNALTVTVDPLPSPVPAGFTGGIGRFTLDASIDKKAPKTGDAVTLKVTVAGTGNIKLVTIPAPVFPADFEAYDPRVSENISKEGNIVRGTKTAEYLIVPRNPGDRIIEPVTFVYFDMARNTYVTLRSPRFTLKVEPGREPMAGATAGASKEDVRLLGEDIRFLKLSPGSLVRPDERGVSAGALAAVAALPVLLFAGSVLYRRRREHMLGNVSVTRARKAGREATRRLTSARKLLGRGDTETYHAEISRALFRYASDRLQIAPSDLSIDSVTAALREYGVAEEAIQRLRSCLETAEFARFAPGRDTREARADLLDEAAAAIDELEGALTRR